MKPVLIAPSILSANFYTLGAEVAAAHKAGADWLHVDVMDGRFVPNITIGPLVVDALAKGQAAEGWKLPLDVHLMIVEPEKYVDDFVRAGADVVTVHAEAATHLHRVLQAIHAAGAKAGRKVLAGVSFNPHSEVGCLNYVADLVDLVLVMSVNPGFGGQKFIPAVLPKIREVARIGAAHGRGWHIEVDGGITPTTAPLVREAGADVLVAGSAVFAQPDYAKAIAGLRSAAR